VRLGINTSCMLPASIEDELPAIADAGFEWVELRTPELRDYLSGHSLEDLRRLLNANGLRVGSINALEFVTFRSDDSAVADCAEHCCWARALECDCVIAVPSPTPTWQTSWDQVVTESVQVLGRLAEIAGPLGVTVGWEPLGFGWCSVRTVAGAAEILRQVDGDVGLVIDLFHLALGGSRLEELDALDGVQVPIVHLDDLPRSTVVEASTDALRVFPGEGDLPIAPILERLRGAGFDGLLSLELFNPGVWDWDVRRIAVRSYAAASSAAG
jgi:2-keto-myo-inositol isomerase